MPTQQAINYSMLVIANLLLVVAVQASIPEAEDPGTCSAEEGCEDLSSPVNPSVVFHHRLQSLHRRVEKKGVLAKDIFISIKTTSKYHSTRLPSILFTWLQNVSPSQVVATLS